MGSAVAAAAVVAGMRVRATTRSASSAMNAPEGVETRSLDVEPDANTWAVEGADVVVLAVKPAGIVAAAAEIAGALPPGAVVVSVAAGIPAAAIEAVLRAGTPVLRAMPNTPAAIGAGVTGVADGANVSAEAHAAVVRLFEHTGAVVEISEARIDALSAVSGSGPAYLFFFAEQFEAAAVRLGFDASDARTLAIGTVTGSARLLAASDVDAAELRRRVTSPNGTTERAIAVMADAGWPAMFDAAFAAAIARAQELGT